MDEEKDLSKTNDVLTHKTLDEHLSYSEILFATIPGVTGILLLIIITAMMFTSLEKVRRKYFQVFAVTHVICFPLFIILTIIHGADTWLNYGFPLGVVTVLLSLLLYAFFWSRKVLLQCKGGFEVVNVEVSNKDTFCYLHIKKPKYYKLVEGQYAFINCPSISFWQWHPFSVCSSNKNENITFLIKNNGDFTSKLIKLFKTTKERAITEQPLYEDHQEAAVSEIRVMEDDPKPTKIEYPGVNLSHPISSPAVLSKTRKNVIYIGTGAGIATFLSFID